MAKQVSKGRQSIQQQVASKMGTRNSPFQSMSSVAKRAFTNKAPATVAPKRGNTGK